MASSETEESSLDSVIVIISLVTMNSSASNHLDKRLLLFHVHSHTVLPAAFERDLLFCDLTGTVFQFSAISDSKAWFAIAAEAPSKSLLALTELVCPRSELIANDP